MLETNTALDATPELLNTAPYEAAWMLKVKLASTATEGLLDATAYASHIG